MEGGTILQNLCSCENTDLHYPILKKEIFNSVDVRIFTKNYKARDLFIGLGIYMVNKKGVCRFLFIQGI